MYFNFKENPYIIIIGDIKDSKKLDDRRAVQKQLNKALSQINREYQKDILTKFIITLGDEFQGVLKKGSVLMEILVKIEKVMYPVQLRFGIGIDRLSTDIGSTYSIGADGPGYYKAREAIESLKNREKHRKTYAADTKVILDDDNKGIETMTDTVFMLMTVLKSAWTDKQREAITDMMIYKDNQSDAAKRLDITQATLQRHLTKGNYYAYKEAVEALRDIFSEIGGRDE